MKIGYSLRIVLSFCIIYQFNQVRLLADLNHICAYSNGSVAKLRSPILNNYLTKSLPNPGISFDWPIDLCDFWISSLYRMRNGQMHNGVDMAAFTGIIVKSSADGIVKSINKNMRGYGNMIEIEHKDGKIVTRYAHLDKILVSIGQKVELGQIIGKVGATGNVRGTSDPSHLHFEIFYDGARVDPLKYLFSSEIDYKNLKKAYN